MTTVLVTELRGVALLDAELAFLEQHRELWDQECYLGRRNLLIEDPAHPDCGTYGCIAGWALVMVGVPVYWRSGRIEAFRTVDQRTIPDVAAELLGLTEHEVDALFAEDNNWGDIQRIAA